MVFQTENCCIFGTISTNELKSLKLYRKLESDTDYRKFLAGIIIAITASQKHRCVFFWLDELEDTIYMTSKQYKEFFQTIRDLVDNVGGKFTVFMNFTFSDAEEESIRMLLGEALWSRINQKIYFKPLNIKEALMYCKDLLQHVQVNKTKGDYSPFEKTSITKMLENLNETNLIPREINRNINYLIQFALKEKKSIINLELYKKWFNSKETEY